jgi:hypothetical protein
MKLSYIFVECQKGLVPTMHVPSLGRVICFQTRPANCVLDYSRSHCSATCDYTPGVSFASNCYGKACIVIEPATSRTFIIREFHSTP